MIETNSSLVIYWDYAEYDYASDTTFAAVEYLCGPEYISHSYMLIAGGNW